MFTASNKTPKSYITGQSQAGGSLALLMKALGQAAEGGANISKNAGTSIAEDKLTAMNPEERGDKNILDQFKGLALTDQFRKRLEGNETDAVKAEAVDKKNTFTTERDKLLEQGRNSRSANSISAANTRAANKKNGTTVAKTGTPEQNASKEVQMSELDKIIMENETAISARDTQNGIGLGEKALIVQQSRKAKYDMLLGMGYGKVDARQMALAQSPLMKSLNKTISGLTIKKKP